MYKVIYYMIVGMHAGDGFDTIRGNKGSSVNKDYDYFLWGHGEKAFGYHGISEYLADSPYLLLQYSSTANDTIGDTEFNVCRNLEGYFKIPKGSIKGSNRSNFALVCKNFEETEEIIDLNEYFIPKNCGIYVSGNSFEYCNAWRFLQNNSRRTSVFGKYKGEFSAEEQKQLHYNPALYCKREKVDGKKIGTINYKAQIVDAVECFHWNENSEEYKLLSDYSPKMK